MSGLFDDVDAQPDARGIRAASASVKVSSLSLNCRQPARCILSIHETRGQRKGALCRLEHMCTPRAHVLRLSERADVRNDALAGDEIHICVTNYCAKKIVTRAEHAENSFDVGYTSTSVYAQPDRPSLSASCRTNARAARGKDASPHSVSVHE